MRRGAMGGGGSLALRVTQPLCQAFDLAISACLEPAFHVGHAATDLGLYHQFKVGLHIPDAPIEPAILIREADY